MSPYEAALPENHKVVLKTTLERIAKLSHRVHLRERRRKRNKTLPTVIIPGTLVRRVPKEKSRPFLKSFHDYFEDKVYEVTRVSKHLLKPLFYLAPIDDQGRRGGELRQKYYREEIQVVNPDINKDTFPNFQILDRRVGDSGRDEVLLHQP